MKPKDNFSLSFSEKGVKLQIYLTARYLDKCPVPAAILLQIHTIFLRLDRSSATITLRFQDHARLSTFLRLDGS